MLLSLLVAGLLTPTQAQTIRQADNGMLNLIADSASIHNPDEKKTGVAKSPHGNNIAYWVSPQSWVSWKFKTNHDARFSLEAEIAQDSPRSRFDLVVGDQRQAVVTQSTGGYDQYQTLQLGSFTLQKGRHSLTISPHRDQWAPINVKRIILRPLKELSPIEPSSTVPTQSPLPYQLSSTKPADWKHHELKGMNFKDHWRDAYPVGSGELGAMVYGGVEDERVMMMHANHWWMKRSPTNLPNVSGKLKHLRSLLTSKDYKPNGAFTKAGQIYYEAIKQSDYKASNGSPLMIGDVHITSPKVDYSDYRRSVDMNKAEAAVTWKSDGARFERRTFVSRANNQKDILFIQLKCDHPGKLQAALSLGLHAPETARGIGNPARFKAQTTASGDFIHYKASNPGTPSALKDFGAVARVITHDGTLNNQDGRLKLSGASHALLAVKTFHYADASDAFDRLDNELEALSGTYQDFLTKHVLAHQALFSSATVDLNATASERQLPNEALLARAYQGDLPLALTERLWAMGRYLNVVGSRAGGDPVHLTGLWNADYTPMWAIHLMNINMPMIHWHIMDGNMAEQMLPFFDLFDALLPGARINAKRLYGTRGIYLNPIPCGKEDGIVKINSPHLIHLPGINAWVAQHYWDYYQFTDDATFLTERALPLMREAAHFYEDYLVLNKDGYYDIIPSNSPENGPFARDGERIGGRHLATQMNSTWEYAAIREMLTNLVTGAEIAGVYTEELPTWKAMCKKLRPYAINAEGAAKEWLHPDLFDNPAHRHMTHAYSLMPGMEINKEDSSPELFDAFVNIVNRRLEAGLEHHTGWSLMHSANLYARGGEGAKAYQCLKWLAQACVLENLLTTHNDWRGGPVTMSQGPIFQIESNMGFVSAVQEMLFSSRPGVLKLMPALPKEWPTGTVRGMRARGGISLNQLIWSKGGANVQATIEASKAQTLRVILPREIKSATLNGKPIKTHSQKELHIDIPSKTQTMLMVTIQDEA